ncbi:DNA gyrase modulator [Clostridiaceae bacterium HSG29]|nr:DNA gyrase modulator [Clostridiaceae bacterium HSG29]
MTKMNEVINELLEKSKNFGFDEAEVMIMDDKNFETTVYKGEIDNYSISENFGLSFRGIKNNIMGYSYTEKLDENSVGMLLENAMNNLKNIDSKDREFLFGNEDNLEYVEINQYNEKLNEILKNKNISFEEMLKNKKVRNELIKICRKNSTLSLKEIGKMFGNISESGVCKILSKE